MIVDCHTRIWATPGQLGPGAAAWLTRNGGSANLPADPVDHALASRQATKTLVWGFRSRHLHADIPNAFLADYVSQRTDVLGIAAVDPPERDSMERLSNISRRSEFIGVTISPAAGGFHPADTRAMKAYHFCAQRRLPVFVECGVDLAPSSTLEYARPVLLDEIARAYPSLTLVIGGLGWPWIDETMAILAKQPRVFADVAGIARRSSVAHAALLKAHEFGVADKLLFGSDFPFMTPTAAIERLYRVNESIRGTGLPAVPREVIRGIIERDAVKLLAG